jgi:ABC-type sugar transport system permease subunit
MAVAIAFLFIPIGLSAYWSMTEYNGLTPPHWVGFDNYTYLLSEPEFQKAVKNTVIFVALGMTIGPALGLGTALLLNEKVPLRGVFRTAYFLPVTTSLVVVSVVWKLLLNEDGLVNAFVELFGIPGQAWLANSNTALPSVVVASIWQGLGFETVVFLAALQSIPGHLYDAAKVDGAGAWARFRHVTLPGLRPTILFIFVIGIIGSFQVFDQVFVMTGGGPNEATRTIVFDLVERFRNLDLGQASAVAYLLLLLLGALSLFQFWLDRRSSR